MTTDTPARLLQLLSLLQTPREWPGGELAERLRVSRRTVRRDIDRLRELGYPVQAARGSDGGYRLVAGKALPPLVVDDEEAVAIAVGLRAGAGHAVEGIEEASVRALAKLEQVLPARLRRRVSVLQSATVPLTSGDGPSIPTETLTVIAAAIAGQERLRFGYRSGEGTESRRLTEPYRLVSTGRRWYLVAYDVERDDWRTFRVDRVSGEPFATGARFTPRELPRADAAEFLRDRMQRGRGTYAFSVRFAASAEVVADRLPQLFGRPEPRGPQQCVLHGNTGDPPEWLAFRLAWVGCDFHVEAPPELVTAVRELGGRLVRAGGDELRETGRADRVGGDDGGHGQSP
ncbi:helix-turn-helix transcriptional regulator [Streptomyces sp. LE64]|uniref:helix-turn-helix transcriptional regulator n=1 Tax=Streptomyces sp. LE64 TaxID=3448653 RepID=UPI004041D033